MPSRASLELRAAAVSVTASDYPNDSTLEQAVLYAEKQQGAVGAVAASGTLTSDATAPSNNDTVTIDTHVYTFKTTLTEVYASATCTSNNTQVTANDTVTLGSITYKFVGTLTGVANEVLLQTDADTSLTHLASAINGTTGAGTTYGTGTVANTAATSSATPTSHVLTFTAVALGTAGNSVVLSKSAATLTVTGSGHLAGGVDPVADEVLINSTAAAALDNLKLAINGSSGAGTSYSTGTVAHTTVSATTNTDTTQVVAALIAGVSGNSIATTETSSHLSFGAAHLTSGAEATETVGSGYQESGDKDV
jgi:hypothetical protein